MGLNFEKRDSYELLNKGSSWDDLCKTCCILKCGVFGCFDMQCHCDNFEDKKTCKECTYKDIVF